MPQPLYPQGKNTWYPMDRRLDRSQSRSGHGGEEKISQPLKGFDSPVIQPVAQRYTTELSRIFLRATCPAHLILLGSFYGGISLLCSDKVIGFYFKILDYVISSSRN
jgi:hypothetical protein